MNASARLTSARIEVAADPFALYELSMREGFGDGLPVLPPTEERVLALLGASPYAPDHVVSYMAPQGAPATTEKIAVNAAMAGVTPEAFPYVVAVVEAIGQREFNMFGLATTTSSVVPAIIVNGPRRAELGFDMAHACMGGAGGRGSATVGRAVQLCLRNIGGQKAGVSSKSVFGQPARSAGLCFAEYEEQSPWPGLAARRGFEPTDECVTVHGSKGTFPIADIRNDDDRDLLSLIAKCIAFPMANLYQGGSTSSADIVLVLNPMWAQRFGREFPMMADLEQYLWDHAWQPSSAWPEPHRRVLEGEGRVDARGRVHIVERPDQLIVAVAGGLGNLHAVIFPSWGQSLAQTTAVRTRD